jgi:hypothetical protein
LIKLCKKKDKVTSESVIIVYELIKTRIQGFILMKLSQILPLVIVGGALATSFVAWEKPAQALQAFNFSFNNTGGQVGGTVSGTLNLPDGNGTFAATSVQIISAPASLGYTLPVDALSYFKTVSSNSFTVSNGTITASSLGLQGNPNINFFGLNFAIPTYGSVLTGSNNRALNSGVWNNTSTTLTYSSATPVPFDMTPSDMLPSIPFLALMYRWRQSRSRIALRTTEKPAVTVS